jgi:hypothetical protein
MWKRLPPLQEAPRFASRPDRSILPRLLDDTTRANRPRGRGAKPRAPRGQPSYRTSSIQAWMSSEGQSRNPCNSVRGRLGLEKPSSPSRARSLRSPVDRSETAALLRRAGFPSERPRHGWTREQHTTSSLRCRAPIRSASPARSYSPPRQAFAPITVGRPPRSLRATGLGRRGTWDGEVECRSCSRRLRRDGPGLQ